MNRTLAERKLALIAKAVNRDKYIGVCGCGAIDECFVETINYKLMFYYNTPDNNTRAVVED